MKTRSTIARLLLAALLLVVLPLWSDGTPSLLAAQPAKELSLKKKASPGAGDAILRSAASGGVTALRRGEEPLPAGHGDTPALGLLPVDPAITCLDGGIRPAAGWNRAAPAFLRVQDKLLFPKHWFW